MTVPSNVGEKNNLWGWGRLVPDTVYREIRASPSHRLMGRGRTKIGLDGIGHSHISESNS
jgi:hypothetical protein